LALRDILRARLALRIYVVGLAQFVVITLGFVAIIESGRGRDMGPHDAEVRFIGKVAELALTEPNMLPQVLESVRVDLNSITTIYDANGAIVATNATTGIPECLALAPKEHPRPGKSGCRIKPIRFPDGRLGRIEHIGIFPSPPIGGTTLISLVLVVVGISSLLLARSLTRPLGKLSTAARALGNGDLKARVGLKSRDELGEVSRAFDEMAERVSALLRAERELLANVSHELRTPLSRIRMALALVADAEGDVAVAQEMLGEIGADLDELERLITDVLTAARLDFEEAGVPSAIPPLRRQEVNLSELLGHAETRFRATHPQRNLEADVPEDLPTVNADPVLLRRVFDNLLENAHKYTEHPDEPIRLVARFGDEIMVDVIDKGMGIASDDLERVFQPFYRVDKSRTRATGGLGLGLPLAKRIVDAHGGKIELLSKINEGTRVRVRLPLARVVDG